MEELLFKAEKNSLLFIKNEAEKKLLGIQQAEDTVTGKANGLFQVAIPVFILLLGFSISRFSASLFDSLFYLSLSLIALFSAVVWKLYRCILPKQTVISGSRPKDALNPELFEQLETDKELELYLIRTSIYSLENAIVHSLQTHTNRLTKFKKANNILIFGFVIILIVTALTSLYLFLLCPLSQYMC